MPCRRPRPARSSSTSSRSLCAAPSRENDRAAIAGVNLEGDRVNLTGRTALQKRNATVAVIGAGDYIGGEIAKKFASEGFTVFAGRRNGAKLKPLGKEIEAAGGEDHPPCPRARNEDGDIRLHLQDAKNRP